MNISFKNSGLKWLWLTVLFIIIDQVTKYYTVANIDLYERIYVMPFFNLTYAQNPGAAFSFLADQPGWQRWFFAAIASIASIVFLVWMAKTPKENKLLSVAFALLLSGAIGNLIDRIMLGYVVDFLDFYYKNYHWPAFNVADSVIFIGAACMILDSFKNDDKPTPSK